MERTLVCQSAPLVVEAPVCRILCKRHRICFAGLLLSAPDLELAGEAQLGQAKALAH